LVSRHLHPRCLPCVGQQQACGWGFQILPYIEQKPLYFQTSGSNLDKSIKAISTPVKTFFCMGPARFRRAAGDSRLVLLSQQRPHLPACSDRLRRNGGDNDNGMVGYIKPVRMAQVTDGLSQTLMLGEKRMDTTYLGQYQSTTTRATPPAGTMTPFAGSILRRARTLMTAAAGELRFGGPWSYGFNAALGDGSVRKHPLTRSAPQPSAPWAFAMITSPWRRLVTFPTFSREPLASAAALARGSRLNKTWRISSCPGFGRFSSGFWFCCFPVAAARRRNRLATRSAAGSPAAGSL